MGRKHAPFYRMVVADVRAPRDGRFIEEVGTYNPNTTPSTVVIKSDRVIYRLLQGAQPTGIVRRLCAAFGIMLVKHLIEGIQKGSITSKTASERFAIWQKANEAKKHPKFACTTSVPVDSLIGACCDELRIKKDMLHNQVSHPTNTTVNDDTHAVV